MKHRSVKELKEQIATLKSITNWDAIEENKVYHIPPIVSLERREIIVIEKEDDKIVYRRIGDADKKERTMYKTSVFAKFLVKRKKF